MTGRITNRLEPIVTLRIVGIDNGLHDYPALVDTGFNGYLTLPALEVQRLGLRYPSDAVAELGDGTLVRVRRFEGRAEWHHGVREIMILESDGGPLLGMSLLKGSRIEMTVAIDAEVAIAPA
jgi:predicted aspartyl protease